MAKKQTHQIDKKLSHLEFRQQVVCSLVANFSSRKRSPPTDKKETLAARKSECCAYKMKKRKI